MGRAYRLSHIHKSVEKNKSKLVHYKGRYGEFDYDPNEFGFDEYDDFKYIGKETEGCNIKIPEGLVDGSFLFKDNKNLRSTPDLPKSCRVCVSMFENCENLEDASNIEFKCKDKMNTSDMFCNCKNLVLPPRILENISYSTSMFNGCLSLCTAPLISKTAAYDSRMFLGNTNGIHYEAEDNAYYRFDDEYKGIDKLRASHNSKAAIKRYERSMSKYDKLKSLRDQSDQEDDMKIIKGDMGE